MTRTTAQFYIDRPIDPVELAAGVADALGVLPNSVISSNLDHPELVPPRWFSNSGKGVGIQSRSVLGDFRTEVVVIAHDDHNYEAMIRSLAIDLNVAILTDEFGVDGLLANDWTLVTPDGRTSMVITNDDETDADHIVLDQASHKILDSRMAHAAD